MLHEHRPCDETVTFIALEKLRVQVETLERQAMLDLALEAKTFRACIRG